MICYEGAIITCDAKDSVAKYLVEDAGKICYVGECLPGEYQNVKRVKLEEKALIPAFVDTHQHFASFATFHAGLNVMDATSNEEIVCRLKKFAKKCKSKVLIAFGASPYSVQEHRLVSRKELDSACADKPIMFVKYDGHACVVNTKLLDMVRDKIESLRGFHEDTGEMQQEAFFAVSDYITNSLSTIELIQNMQKAMDYMAEKGIGMVHSVSGVGFPKDLDIDLERWVGRGAQRGFQLRVFPQSMNVETAIKRKLPRIGGCFANALDGCFGSMDAALRVPYKNSDSKGVLYYSDEQVRKFCMKANRLGLQIEMHAIGDAAFDQATRALKAALDDFPRKDHRHGIIHACLPTEEGLEICRKYKIQLPMQTAFIDWKQEPDEYLDRILGERSQKLNPVRKMIDMGIVVSAGSDAPCTDPDPIMWMYKACNHSVKEQSITIQEALKMCTYNGYYTTFDEKERGSLEKGKLADMVILSNNPYEMEPERIKELQVEMLILQGKEYKKQQKSVVGMVLKGLISKRKI